MMIVATTNDLPGYRVVRSLGLVRGITVRSRSVFGTIGGGHLEFDAIARAQTLLKLGLVGGAGRVGGRGRPVGAVRADAVRAVRGTRPAL